MSALSQKDGWVAIVDDDASIRRSLARMFQCKGISAQVFGSAEAYLRRCKEQDGEPRCIVLDVHLDGLNGFELQDSLVSQGAAPPIIFMTAMDDIPTTLLERRACTAGTCGYLRKPFDMNSLIALVRPHLSTKVADGRNH